MNILSIVCIIFAVFSQVLTAQVTGSITTVSAIPSTDNTHAQKPISTIDATLHTGMSAGIIFGYGFKAGYDFGAGVRVGYSFQQLYVGGMGMYNFGQSITAGTGSLITDTDIFGYSIAGEVGYDILLGKKAIVRPLLGVGMSKFIENSTSSGQLAGGQNGNVNKSSYVTNLLVSPAILVQFPIKRDILFGGDIRYTIVAGEGDHNGFGLYTTFIYRF